MDGVLLQSSPPVRASGRRARFAAANPVFLLRGERVEPRHRGTRPVRQADRRGRRDRRRRRAAEILAAAWPSEVHLYGSASELRTAFADCQAVVAFLAVGAAVRALAPVLGHKSTDAAVVCVDESLRHAVAVLGGHHGANDLAERVSTLLGCTPVITTASDAAGAQPLDSYGADLGFTIENPDQLAPVGAALLSGAPVAVAGADDWPLPALAGSTTEGDPEAAIAISDLASDFASDPASLPAA